VNRSGAIGTATAEAVVRYLRANGWPAAERTALHGIHDVGDITGTPGLAWEVKGGAAAEYASDGQVSAWLADTERERLCAGANVGILVLKRKGIGAPNNTGRWWAVVAVDALAHMTGAGGLDALDVPARLHLADACALLRRDGYGSPIVVPPHVS